MNTAQRLDEVGSINRSREPSSSGNLGIPPIIGQPKEVRTLAGNTSAEGFERSEFSIRIIFFLILFEYTILALRIPFLEG